MSLSYSLYIWYNATLKFAIFLYIYIYICILNILNTFYTDQKNFLFKIVDKILCNIMALDWSDHKACYHDFLFVFRSKRVLRRRSFATPTGEPARCWRIWERKWTFTSTLTIWHHCLDSEPHTRLLLWMKVHIHKQQFRHIDEIAVIGCTESCHSFNFRCIQLSDNFQCSQWQNFSDFTIFPFQCYVDMCTRMHGLSVSYCHMLFYSRYILLLKYITSQETCTYVILCYILWSGNSPFHIQSSSLYH